jgi:hypothetical protein
VIGTPRWQVACAAAAGLLALCAAAAAAAPTSTTYVSKAAGFRITVPNDWRYVPNTVAQIEADVATLRRERKTALADIYASIIATPAGRSAVGGFAFDAFLYPAISSTQTEIVLEIARTTRAYTPAQLAPTFAKQLASTPGARVDTPRTVSLPAGGAAFIEGTGAGAEGFELYLIPHGKLLYELSLHGRASDLRKETVFASIARGFAFV